MSSGSRSLPVRGFLLVRGGWLAFRHRLRMAALFVELLATQGAGWRRP